MAADPIREPDFGTVLDRAVADFRKALLKRWRERAAEVVAEGKGRFPQGWRRSGGAEPMWPYWEALARLHVDYRHYRCRVVHWAESGQNGPVPKCEGSMDLGPVSMERPSYIDAKGVQRAIPDRIECGMPQIMAQIEAWSHQEAAVVRAALPEFGVHDLGEIEQAQAALLNLGGQLGLEAAKGSTRRSRSSRPAMPTCSPTSGNSPRTTMTTRAGTPPGPARRRRPSRTGSSTPWSPRSRTRPGSRGACRTCTPPEAPSCTRGAAGT
nr:hypothetical protein GCM10025732_46000 [Glycomyces mayteni]